MRMARDAWVTESEPALANCAAMGTMDRRAHPVGGKNKARQVNFSHVGSRLSL